METGKTERFPQLFAGLAALALALVLAAVVGAGAVKAAKRSGDQIEVTGSAKKQIRSDYAVLRMSASTQGASLQEAYAQLDGYATQVRGFLGQSGVADSLVTERPVETESLYRMTENGMQTGEVVGYRLTRRWEVRSADVAGVTALSQRATSLINQGIPLQAGSPEYLYTRLNEVRTQMLAEATQDAKGRAESIAKSAGARIGAVRSARMGVFQITPRNSTEVSDYGINDTSSLEKDITAVVRVTFSVE
ncbi:MAG TPA: SIMPL domain-containing protein [Longimicrobium sp.]|nr:SIMPL domain-containing protein [Longimicrobium sp.]